MLSRPAAKRRQVLITTTTFRPFRSRQSRQSLEKIKTNVDQCSNDCDVSDGSAQMSQPGLDYGAHELGARSFDRLRRVAFRFGGPFSDPCSPEIYMAANAGTWMLDSVTLPSSEAINGAACSAAFSTQSSYSPSKSRHDHMRGPADRGPIPSSVLVSLSIAVDAAGTSFSIANPS